MKTQILIKVSGYVSLLLFIFHVFFYWMFNWQHSLACLNQLNYGIMLTFHIICSAFIFTMAVASLKYTEKLTEPGLGKLLSLYFAFFYLFRIVAEFLYFSSSTNLESTIIVVFCAIPGLSYLYAAVKTR